MKENRQNLDIESDKVLEEIWHTVDCELPTATFRRRCSLFRNVCTALIRMRDDALGACLCCRKPIGLKRRWKTPWTPFCIRCQIAVDRNDGEILRRAQAASGGTNRQRDSTDLAAGSESVVRGFLRRRSQR